MTEPANNREDALRLTNDIMAKATTGSYIFRGENKDHGRITSSLYREYRHSDILDHLDIGEIQQIELSAAFQHGGEDDEPHHLLHMLQHHRGKTNLIDFTEDCLIALFFACDGKMRKDGRIIFLERAKHQDNITKPSRPVNRVIAQKSIFFEAPIGYLDLDEFEQIEVPSVLKPYLLDLLRDVHGITGANIYNDMHGYVTRRELTTQTLQTVAEGLRLQQNGDYEKAVDKFTDAIRVNRDNPAPYVYRATAHYHLGLLDQSIADNDKAIDLYPQLPVPYNNRGNAHAAKGNHQEAIADYTKAIGIDPGFANAYNGRGVIRYLNSDPDHSYRNVHGIIRYQNDELDRAIRDFDRAIRHDPQLAIAYCNRGLALRWREGSQPAIDDFSTAIELDRNLAVAYYNRGLLRREFRQQGADEDLEEARRIDPSLVPPDEQDHAQSPM